MDKDRLIRYLEDVYKLELQRRTTDVTLGKISQEYKRVEKDKNKGEAQKEGRDATTQYHNHTLAAFKFKVAAGGCFFMVICTIFFLAYINKTLEHDRVRYENVMASESEFEREFYGNGARSSIESDLEDKKMVQTVMGVMSVGGVICVLLSMAKKKDSKAELEKVKTNGSRLANVSDRRMKILSDNFDTVKNAQEETERVLQRLYSLNIIYPKYRYLEACGTFLEYLRSGRAVSLEATAGYAGAYNLFEEELFRGEISNKLDCILQNQRILINGQKEILNRMNQLMHGIVYLASKADEIKDGIDKNTRAIEVSAFYSAVSAYNTTVVHRLDQRYY